MKRVLVAEDEASIREFVVINLERSGYTVEQAADGAEALSLFRERGGDFDVAILDIMMPHVSGLEVCRAMRAQNSNIGIIMLTARTQEMDKVTGLMMGADDYVTKPFSTSELMARVDVLYRRVEMGRGDAKLTDTRIERGDFVLDLRGRTLQKCGVPIELTQVEFQMMEVFLKNAGAALTRADILHLVWGAENYGEEKIVDVNVRRLRMKIEDNPSMPQYLQTVWGVGYRWLG